MIKLYGVAGACSLSPHILLEELQIPYELKLMDWKDKAAFDALKKINPMRQVPTLETEEGYPLAEGLAIQQYLISKKPNQLFPTAGRERFKAFEWLSFIGSELHKTFVPLFNPKAFSDEEAHHEGIKKKGQERLERILRVAERRFSDGPYALGENFTLVDIYLFVVLSWTSYFKIDLAPYSKLSAFVKKVAQRPAVVRAMKQEGLV